MSSIAIITDTDASLPNEVAREHGIVQVPINIHFGAQTYQTGVDIDDRALFERVDRDRALPTTSAPTPGQFAAAYRAAAERGCEAIVCFCVSSAISATYTAAEHAKALVPECDVTVVDSCSISMGQGYMALEAVKAAGAGAGVDEIIARAEAVRERTYLYAALDTLKYLAMSGRVGHLAAGMASLLAIKPVLTLRDGKLEMLEKVRTLRKAWHRVIDLTVESLDGRPAEQLAILHVNAVDAAHDFAAHLCEVIACAQPPMFADFSAGLSVHTGPGMVGVVAVAAGG